MTTQTTTVDLARKMGEVAGALREYAYLPWVDRVSVTAAGRVYVTFPYSLHSKHELTALCARATEFDTRITLEMSYGGSGEARIEVELGGHHARLWVSLHSGQAYELGAALRRPISTDQPTLTVTAEDLLAAICGSDGGQRG